MTIRMAHAVDNLQQRVRQLEQIPAPPTQALESLEEHIEALRADVAQLKREITAMKARMGKHTSG